MIVKDQFKIAAAGVAARLFAYYDEGPRGLFGSAPVSESGWLWWQTPVALQALLLHEELSQDYSKHYKILESFRLNNDEDHRMFSPAWGGIENDEKNDDMLWWTLAALQTNDSSLWESAARSHDHVHRFWARQEHSSCSGGGIRWSADPSQSGWSYLNSVTNGQAFLSSALLLREPVPESDFAGQSSARPNFKWQSSQSSEPRNIDRRDHYEQWAERTYTWMKRVSLISAEYAVYDGITEPACSIEAVMNTEEWSYNIALLILGTAVMYSRTHDFVWLQEHELLKEQAISKFVSSHGILYEPACKRGCNGNDYKIFLAIMVRSLAQSYQLVPDARVQSVLLASALDGIRACDASSNWTCRELYPSCSGSKQASAQSSTSIQSQVVALELINAVQQVL